MTALIGGGATVKTLTSDEYLPSVAWCLQERDAKGADSDTKPGHLIPILRGGFFDEPVAIAFQSRIARNGRGQPSEIVPALNGSDAGATSDMRPVVACFQQSSQAGKGTVGYDSSGIAKPCKTQQDGQMIHCGMAVRRLTPRECERLQGFPDDWTRYADSEKQSEFSDSVRYKMLGNAVNVACSRWIGQRMVRFASEVLA